VSGLQGALVDGKMFETHSWTVARTLRVSARHARCSANIAGLPLQLCRGSHEWSCGGPLAGSAGSVRRTRSCESLLDDVGEFVREDSPS
jgi:hypothetical protein